MARISIDRLKLSNHCTTLLLLITNFLLAGCALPRSAQQSAQAQQARVTQAAYRVRVIGGPVCETYVYWRVEASAFGEGSETRQG